MLIDKQRSGLFNQAIMEFGALQCVPAAPACFECPFASQCMAYATKKVNLLPVKQGKTKVKERYLYYFHIIQGEKTYLSKRQGKGVWHNLYEFPVLESDVPLKFPELQANPVFQEMFRNIKEIKFRLVLENKKHVLSHRKLFASFYEVIVGKEGDIRAVSDSPGSFIRIPEYAIDAYPVHRLMEFYLENYYETSKQNLHQEARIRKIDVVNNDASSIRP
jgi:A/G-specific adenine glycosylase